MNKIKEKNPLYINLTNPQYIEIDGMFFSSLLIINYNRIFQELIFKNILEINENILISIYIEKNNQYKIIKEIARNIGNTTVDLEKINNSRIDIDIAKSSLEDAKYIRKEMQLNNQQLLYFYTYITTYSKNKEELKNQINKIEEILQNSGLKSKNHILDRNKQY